MNLVVMKKLGFLGALYILAVISSIANPPLDKYGKISGQVFDNKSKHSIEYATVSLSDINGKLVTGTITNSIGHFSIDNIKNGTYKLTVSFLGYEDIVIEDVVLSDRKRNIDLSGIYITPSSENLEEVTIVSNVAPVQYKIDKKIINVSKQFATISGTAIDVLENIPSVRVDIEGNVSLRGSSGFTVLIDGRPTILDANDALQQMPASNIQNIELITNPSVKYDPDGSAGIINIITKKKKMQGVSGIVNLNAGLDDKYGGDFLFNLKAAGFNFFAGADYNLWGDNGTVLIEWMHGKYLKDENDYIKPFINKMLLVRIEDKFFDERLEAEIGTILRPVQKDFGYAGICELTLNFKNGLTVSGGGFFFIGNEDDLFYLFEDKDMVYLKARMEF